MSTQQVSLDAYTMLERAYAFEYQRAERWEAIARQLGAALELSVRDFNPPGDGAQRILAALSVYRDAIKEEPT